MVGVWPPADLPDAAIGADAVVPLFKQLVTGAEGGVRAIIALQQKNVRIKI